jgi:cytochrome c biogenesis protein CcdA
LAQPCCITYLLPAYFANVFKEKKRILLMRLIYSAGIFTVMLPIVLGAKALATLFFKLHDTTYLVGGGVLIGLGVLSFLGLKLPMPHFRQRRLSGGRTDVVTTFGLGLMGGITSACCAPVLLGVLTLSALSPNVVLSLGVGVAYVLGMVTPLSLLLRC